MNYLFLPSQIKSFLPIYATHLLLTCWFLSNPIILGFLTVFLYFAAQLYFVVKLKDK